MPVVPRIKRIPSPPIPAEHADPTPVLLRSVGGRVFTFCLVALASTAWALHTGKVDASAWTTVVVSLGALIAGSTTAKKVGGAWLHSRSAPSAGVYVDDHIHGADVAPYEDEPVVMDVPKEASP